MEKRCRKRAPTPDDDKLPSEILCALDAFGARRARACGGGHSYRYRFRAAPCAHVFKSASPLPSSPGPRAPRILPRPRVSGGSLSPAATRPARVTAAHARAESPAQCVAAPYAPPSELVAPRVHACRRPCHVDLIVGLTPLNEQVATGQRHRARTLGLAGEHGGDGERARAGAARQRGSRATLPHLHLQVRGREHLHELRVGLRREGGVHLERRADGGEVEGVHLRRPRRGGRGGRGHGSA